MASLPDLSALSSSEKDTLITALAARIDALVARVEALEAENTALREKRNRPPKTPDTSSKPPSQGVKTNGESQAKPKGKAHAGAHRRDCQEFRVRAGIMGTKEISHGPTQTARHSRCVA